MKGLKISLMLVAAALMLVGVSGTTYAFHDGGVATCEGCHTMHNSLNGSIIGLDRQNPKILTGSLYNAANQYLLKGTDQSSTCLNCHRVNDAIGAPNNYHIMSTQSGAGATPVERTPGGDFAWLLVNGVNTTGGTTNKGNHHGHNIIAQDFGLTSSTNYSAIGNVSPGGSYPADKFYCNSCHDPHPAQRIDSSLTIVSRTMTGATAPIVASGSYAKDDGTGPGETPTAGLAVGVYRILGGVGYQPKSAPTAPAFGAAQPFAFAPATYNNMESAGQVKVAYGSGMSEWCGNCHGGLVNSAADPSITHRHPAGALALLNNGTGNEMNIYNAYVKTGDMTGSSTSSNLSLVPFERGIALDAAGWTQLASYASGTTVSTGTSMGGPGATANVMCLSCHRAHATAFQESTRWDANGGQYLTMDGQYVGTDNYNTTITDSGSAQRIANNIGYTQAQLKAAYYDRDPSQFASFQRSLCNKCHAKD